MAYIAGDLTPISSANGYNFWRYDTEDAHTTVDAAGYFDNNDDSLNITVGDIVFVVVWNTVRTGTPSAYGTHLCTSVSAAGVVDFVNVTAGEMTDSD